MNIYRKIYEAQSNNEDVALCTIVNTRGSAPRKIGAKMIVSGNGSIYGTIGGGALEKKTIEDAIEVINKKEPKLFRHDLLHQHSMCCGGTVDIYIEPIMKKNRLYIFGAGHTGIALAKHATDTGFEVVVVDDRKEYIEQLNLEGVEKMNLPFDKASGFLPFNKGTFIAIMTYNHDTDRNILANCIKKPHAYLGMIGSRRKVEITKKMFREASIATDEELNAVDMPMGIDIKSESPEEIAISILARLIETKHTVLK